MQFKESKAIYLQIAERLCNEILQDKYPEEERIPSVREYAAEVEVNVNTMMRTFEYLQQNGIIFNRRGIGYFVSSGAKSLIYESQKKQFLNEDLKDFFKRIQLLNISIEEIVELHKSHTEQQSKSKKL